MSFLERVWMSIDLSSPEFLSAEIAGLIAVLLACVVFQAWTLWRVRTSLRALQPLDERVTRLTRSVALLVDTTEGCFEAISGQLAKVEDKATASRQQRQRRVTRAAKSGRSVAQISAQESISEGEAALRVRMAQNLQVS